MFEPKMPFGKFKGRFLRDIDTDYLVWLLAQRIQPGLQFDVETEIVARRHRRIAEEEGAARSTPSRTQRIPTGVDLSTARELLAAGRRALAQRYHPDRPDGNSMMMVAANCTADWLEQVVADQFGGVAR